MINNISKISLLNNGYLYPLFIDSKLTNGTGLMNPSIFFDDYTNKLLCIVRHVNYTFFHSEEDIFHHYYGPLQYIHPENEPSLITVNYLVELDINSLVIKNVAKINTNELDTNSKWEFVGLEDARLFRWDRNLYISGVRRDTTTDGEGRMELSQLDIDFDRFVVNEIFRYRIPLPNNESSYCEKNWMPILNKPYYYIKWANPTEVVSVDIKNNTTNNIITHYNKDIEGLEFRGSSHVIQWNGYYLAVIHEVNLFNSDLGHKNGRYYHRFLLWDDDFNLIKYSDIFNFMDGHIEFCCGMSLIDEYIYISFGFQDNCAFVLKFPEYLLNSIFEL